MPIIRRNNCIYATLGTCYFVWMTVWYAGGTLHTRQSSIQNNKYQVSHKYSYVSWWWAHSRPKHVEERNKHTKKNCAPSWLYLQKNLRTFHILLSPTSQLHRTPDRGDFRSPQRSCWALWSSEKLHCRELPAAGCKHPQRQEPTTPVTLRISSYLLICQYF